MTRLHRRVRYALLALATIALGLTVHADRRVLPPAVRDFTGDALWAAMNLFWLSALVPAARRSVRAGVTYALCVLVELSQLYHAPWIDSLRRTRAGALVLGSGFDPRDLVAYALGVALAALCDRALVRPPTNR